MKIYISMPHREPVSIEILETAKISDLKKEIASKIPEVKLSEQILKFESKVVLGDVTLKKCGITENSMIELTAVLNKTDDIKVHAAESQQLLIAKLKNMSVTNETQTGPGSTLDLGANLKLKLNLVLPNAIGTGTAEQIDVPNTYKISQLKDFIVTKWKIPVYLQTVSCMEQILDNNNKTLADYNIPNLSTIIVKPFVIEIFINVDKICYPLQVLPTDTVKMVKKKFQGQGPMEIHPKFQRLIWNGVPLEDHDVLITKGIVRGSTLNLIALILPLKLKIWIGELHENVQFDIIGDETIGQLKQKIENKTKIPCDEQSLTIDYGSMTSILSDDLKTCLDYGLSENSKLFLKRIGTLDDELDLWVMAQRIFSFCK